MERNGDMKCPDCKVEMDLCKDGHFEIWSCPKCFKKFDEEDIERNSEE